MKLLLLTSLTVAQCLAFGSADRCEVQDGNKVTQFDDRRNFRVQVPCKYRLVRQVCGDYRVFVTVGHAFLYPAYEIDYVWLAVVHTRTARTWRGQTSGNMLNMYMKGESSDPFKTHWGNYSFKALFSTTKTGKRITVAENNDAFSLTLKTYDFDQPKQSELKFLCNRGNAEKTPYPQQFCGSGLDRSEVGDQSQEYGFGQQGNLTILLDALSDPTIVQFPGSCLDTSRVLLRCRNKEEAIENCHHILDGSAHTKCILKNSCNHMDAFRDCVMFVCSHYKNQNACTKLGKAIRGCEGFSDTLRNQLESKDCMTWVDPKDVIEKLPDN